MSSGSALLGKFHSQKGFIELNKLRSCVAHVCSCTTCLDTVTCSCVSNVMIAALRWQEQIGNGSGCRTFGKQSAPWLMCEETTTLRYQSGEYSSYIRWCYSVRGQNRGWQWIKSLRRQQDGEGADNVHSKEIWVLWSITVESTAHLKSYI